MTSIAQTAYRGRHSDEAKQLARSIEAWERRDAYEPRHEMPLDTHVRFVELPHGVIRKIRVFVS